MNYNIYLHGTGGVLVWLPHAKMCFAHAVKSGKCYSALQGRRAGSFCCGNMAQLCHKGMAALFDLTAFN